MVRSMAQEQGGFLPPSLNLSWKWNLNDDYEIRQIEKNIIEIEMWGDLNLKHKLEMKIEMRYEH